MIRDPRASAQPSVISWASSSTYSDWDSYLFGLSVGVRTLRVAPRHGLKRLILPVEYVRCTEFRYVLEHLDVTADQFVLDIGSPKLLSLFLAARIGATVYATDLTDYFFAAYGAYADSVLSQYRERFRMETQDARALTYASEIFDRVFSISVIEHIPDDGDRVAMQEITRVLKPGGICCLTVPWSDRGYVEEFFSRRGECDVYWISSEKDVFFYQRAYDWETLERRLLSNSGLGILDVSFWGERKVAVEDVLLNRRLPRVVRWAMYPAHFPLSRLFLRQLTAEEPSRKKVACLTLCKPAR